ncbi:MAG: ABC transporter permease [Reichenbachiella sp.]
MFKNFFVLAYRHFVRSPLTSSIELFGMTAGLTVFLLVALWVMNESSYDKHINHLDRIYRLEMTDEDAKLIASSFSPIAPALKAQIPAVEEAMRMRIFGWQATATTSNNLDAQSYFVGHKLYADPEIIDFLSVKFISGDPKTALARKHTAVITESLAETIFGISEAAIGNSLFFSNGMKQGVTITGVVEDVKNFHLPYQLIMSFASLEDHPGSKRYGFDDWNSWDNRFYAYLRVGEYSDINELENSIKKLVDANSGLKDDYTDFSLFPLSEVYFDDREAQYANYSLRGDKVKMLTYGSIALFALLIACINFINLNNAKSLERAREVGIKKVSGASRRTIFIQFLGEASLMCVISMILALIFTHTLLPQFNTIMNVDLSINLLMGFLPVTLLIGMLVFVSLMSGGFPALFISSFQPMQVIKGLQTKKGGKIDYQKLSLVIQFSLTIILIIGSITVYRQVHFLKNTDLGFDKNALVAFECSRENTVGKSDILKNLLAEHPNVISASHMRATPGHRTVDERSQAMFYHNGIEYYLPYAPVDENYFETLGLELIAGRFFDYRKSDKYWRYTPDNNVEGPGSVVLNETAVKNLGLTDPVGTKIQVGDDRDELYVIGVVKDFHLASLNKKIDPLIFFNSDLRFQMVVKIATQDMPATINFIQDEVARVTGKRPSPEFLDVRLNRLYGDDEKFAKLVGYFTIIGIIIAAMGLFGVASRAIKIRIKEIGIRKSLGASSGQILGLLLSSFIKVVLIAGVIAIPIGWYLTSNWLDNYAYHTDVTLWVFLAACGLTLIIALLTIFWNSWRASSMNPARLIRYE